MGTHPIFESDFDCLTDVLIGTKKSEWLQLRRPERNPRRLAMLLPLTALTQSKMALCKSANSKNSSREPLRSKERLETSERTSPSHPLRPKSKSMLTLTSP